MTDSTGSYTIRYVLPGTYALHANPDASTGLLGAWHGGALYAEQRTPPDGSVMVSAASGQSVSGVDFALPRGARIAGTILGGGLPLAGAQVQVFGSEGQLAYRTHSGAEGQYALSPLLPATYRVKVLADGFADLWWNSADNAVGAANLTMGLGDEATLDFDLAKGQSPALVQVTSDPPGAEIYLDFHPTGEVTPAMIDVGEVGAWDAHGHWPASHVIPLNGPASHVIPLNRLASHVITLKRAGSPQPSPRSVPAVEAETIVEHFDLTDEAAGAVLVETIPAGAEVFVDYADAPAGVSPVLVENLTPGSHTILLRKEGYLRPRPVMVNVGDGTMMSETFKRNSFSDGGALWQSGMDQTFELALPFSFDFYGNTYSNCFVDIHGTIYFSPRGSDYEPSETKLAERPMIAALWQDYYPSDVTLAIEDGSDGITVRWHRDSDVNYSLTLQADGRIVLKYGEGNVQGGMIGVSAGDGVRYTLSSRSQTGSMLRADDIVFEPVSTHYTTIQVPLTLMSDDHAIDIAVRCPAVPEMDIYVDYLPTEQVTDAVVEWLDPASHADATGGIWHSASHTILLRKPGIRPFAPRFVAYGTNTFQTLTVLPWMLDYTAITLEEALDTEGSTHPPAWSTDPFDAPWSPVAEVMGNGEDAAVSSPVGHGGQSWLAMSVTNSGTLTFNWRVSCQPRYDFMLLTVDGAVQGRLSGESGWLTKSLEIEGEGAHEVVWRYVKDGSVAAGMDRAWVDRVAWMPADRVTLEEALDTTNLVWQSGGDAVWYTVTDPSIQSGDAARSGQIGDYGISALETTVTGPGRLQFFWRVSSEPYGDWLDFLVDGVLEGTLTGADDFWELFTMDIGFGTHTLAWEYWKNESTAAGEDAGFLDGVVWIPAGAPPTHTSTTPVPVPFAWLDGYPSLMAAASGDYEAAAWTATGKRDGAGNALAVWQDYVAGTCPTNPGSQFRCFIEMPVGTPVLSWDPDLGDERVYTIWGRSSLLEGGWTTPTNAASRFFRVDVSMP